VVGKEARSRTAGDGVHEQVQLVEQSVSDEGVYEGGAAAHVDTAADLGFDPADGIGAGWTDDLGGLTGTGLEGRRDHVFGGLVHEGCAGVFFSCAGRPGGLEHLVGVAAQQDGIAAGHEVADVSSHGRVVTKVEGPGWGVDYPVKAGELVY